MSSLISLANTQVRCLPCRRAIVFENAIRSLLAGSARQQTSDRLPIDGPNHAPQICTAREKNDRFFFSFFFGCCFSKSFEVFTRSVRYVRHTTMRAFEPEDLVFSILEEMLFGFVDMRRYSLPFTASNSVMFDNDAREVCFSIVYHRSLVGWITCSH